MQSLLNEIRQCAHCKDHLPKGPRPVLSASTLSKIVIIGQAPGAVVHSSGIPWQDKSGENLRQWMNVDTTTFYNEKKIALLPMGFCYPGKGKFGDLPPRKECAPLWHQRLLSQCKEVKLILLIGQYAQEYYLEESKYKTLTNRVMHYKDYLPQYFVLPHPSPRNNLWQSKNNWFKQEVVPALQEKIHCIL